MAAITRASSRSTSFSASFVDRIANRWAGRAGEGPGGIPDDLSGETRAVVAEAPTTAPASGHNRRRFLTRVTLGASALTVDPLRFLLEPVSAWDAVCGSGNTCGEGWSVFCCTINNGSNTCPSGSFVAGWWKSDASSFCGGGPRYIIDCNQTCGVACNCTCPTGTCDNRRTCCNQFRYGQCHQEISCAGPVRCRLVTCVPPWQIDATCTTASATDNRTSDHNAPCNTYEPPPPPPPVHGAMPGAGPIQINHDGRIEAFGIAATTFTIQNVYQYAIGSGWSGWSPIGGTWPIPNTVTAARNASGSLQIFVRATDGQISTSSQGAIGTGWTPFIAMGGNFSSPPVVARNLDGRLQLFAIGTDGKLKTNAQVAANGLWVGWTDMGGALVDTPAVGTTVDGRLFACAVGTDGKMYGIAQTTPNGTWTPLVSFGSGLSGRPAIGRNADGILVVACLDTTGKVLVYRQAGFGWVLHQTLSLPMGQAPCIGTNKDGRLELFSIAPDGMMHHTWQATPGAPFVGWYGMPLPAGTTYTSQPWVISNPDGRLEVFARGADGKLWHDFQNAPNAGWFGPTYLGGTLVS